MLDTIILAGGFGTRLREVVSDVPKPMAKVKGKPFLDYVLEQVKFFEAKTIILSVGYQKESIKGHYQNRGFLFSEEKTPLGTGGAVKKALKLAQSSDVLVLNGDSFFGLDLHEMYRVHQKNGADLTIACKRVNDVSRYGSLTFDKDMSLTGFYEKEVSKESGWINGGIYMMKKDLLFSFPDHPFSLEKEVFPALLNNRLFAYLSEAKFIDIGTKESYLKAGEFFT